MKKFFFLVICSLVFGAGMGAAVFYLKYNLSNFFLYLLVVVVCSLASVFIFWLLTRSESVDKMYGYCAGTLTAIVGAITAFILLPHGEAKMISVEDAASSGYSLAGQSSGGDVITLNFRIVEPLSMGDAIVVFLIPGIIACYVLVQYLWNKDRAVSEPPQQPTS